MNFSIIVAADLNGVIGLKGEMPWKKLSADLKYFKDKTMHHWCILGRKTFNALGNNVLPGRKFIIVTRDRNFVAKDCIVVHSLNDAMKLPEIQTEPEVFILGGGDIYKQAVHFTHRIYLTRIHAIFYGDTYFHIPDPENWQLTDRKDFEKDAKNPYDYSFLVFDRV